MSAPRTTLRPAALAALLALMGAGCESDPAPILSVELIDPETGGNPALDVVVGTLRVDVEEAGASRCQGDPVECTAEVRNGSFDLVLPIREVTALSRVQAYLEGGDRPRQGASPLFGYRESLQTLPVRVPMLAPGTCVPLGGPSPSAGGLPLMAVGRRDMGVAVRRNIALVVGGLEAGGPSARVDRYDLATADVLTLDSRLDPGLLEGPTRGLVFTEDLSLFVAAERAVVYRFEPESVPVPRRLSLHAGASERSALVRVDADRAAVVAGTASDGLTWISRAGGTVSDEVSEVAARLTAPRTDPAVAALDGGLLVLGGGEAGAPTAERVARDGDGEAAGFEVGEGRGGWLAPGPGGAFLWVGRVLDDGSIASDTVLLTGCPRCEVRPGPTWDAAREGVAFTVTEAGDAWLVGGGDPASDVTERIRWTDATPRFEAGPTLADGGRSGASVVEHGSGVVAVLGGLGGPSVGLRDDLELCLAADGLDPF